MRTSECDLVIAGVGGQGVLMISDVIGRAAVLAGKPVCGAETHGMAQRGGSVINHTRIGCRYSPLVAAGSADLLVLSSRWRGCASLTSYPGRAWPWSTPGRSCP